MRGWVVYIKVSVDDEFWILSKKAGVVQVQTTTKLKLSFFPCFYLCISLIRLTEWVRIVSLAWHGTSRLVIVLQLLVEGLVDGLVLQVDHPAGLQPVEDLPRVLAHPEEVLVDVGEVVAVLLGEDEALLGDPPRVGQVAPVGGVRVEPHGVGGRGQPPGDLCDGDGDPISKR